MDIKRKHTAISTVNWLIGLAMLASITMPQNSIAKTGCLKTSNYYEIFTPCPNGGSITMLETILRISTNNVNETIVHITVLKLENGFVKNLNGCKNAICEIDLKRFSKGLYKVIVKTSQTTFADSFIIQ